MHTLSLNLSNIELVLRPRGCRDLGVAATLRLRSRGPGRATYDDTFVYANKKPISAKC